MNAIRTLHSAGGALFDQARLHAQLARVEWAEEKNRLLRMLLVILIGLAFLICVLLSAGALLVAASWDTQYRMHAIAALVVVYSLGMAAAWRRFQAWSAGGDAFAASREELAADGELLKTNL